MTKSIKQINFLDLTRAIMKLPKFNYFINIKYKIITFLPFELF